MKKMKIMLVASLLMVIGFSAQAADSTIDRLWSSQFTTASGLGGEVDGVGTGWWVEIFNVTDNASTAGNTAASLGWVTGFGYVEDAFQFTATESDSVRMRLFNNANPLNATFRIDSAAQTLANLDNLTSPGPTDLNVTFDFTSSTWQAVPEPATFLLFGMGGMGAWLVRRRKRLSVSV
ncbi:MAG: PEP-CTERM sorting domain-containing protein [Kiritimatiellales bacterium]